MLHGSVKLAITDDIALADLCTEFQGDLSFTLKIRAFGGSQRDVSRLFHNLFTWITAAEDKEGGERVFAHQQEPQNCQHLFEEEGQLSRESPSLLRLLR